MGQHIPCPQSAGARCQKSPSYAVYWFNSFTCSSYIFSSLRLHLLLSSGVHDLPQIAAMVGSICLWKVTLKFKFWCHHDIIISASALLPYYCSGIPVYYVSLACWLWVHPWKHCQFSLAIFVMYYEGLYQVSELLEGEFFLNLEYFHPDGHYVCLYFRLFITYGKARKFIFSFW